MIKDGISTSYLCYIFFELDYLLSHDIKKRTMLRIERKLKCLGITKVDIVSSVLQKYFLSTLQTRTNNYLYGFCLSLEAEKRPLIFDEKKGDSLLTTLSIYRFYEQFSIFFCSKLFTEATFMHRNVDIKNKNSIASQFESFLTDFFNDKLDEQSWNDSYTLITKDVLQNANLL